MLSFDKLTTVTCQGVKKLTTIPPYTSRYVVTVVVIKALSDCVVNCVFRQSNMRSFFIQNNL